LEREENKMAAFPEDQLNTGLTTINRKVDCFPRGSTEHGSHHDKQKSVHGKLAVNQHVGFEEKKST
jgi:hypothetical protein